MSSYSLSGGGIFKPSGTVTDDFMENWRLNPTTFSSTSLVGPDFRESAITNGMPVRLSHLPDTTAWATQPTAGSWYDRRVGQQSQLRPTGTTGIAQAGGVV